MYSVEEIGEEQERQYIKLMQEDDQYCHPESFKWGFEHGFEYALSKLGWHPASEPPEYAEEVIILFKHGAYHNYPLIPMRFKYLGKWFMNVKWWCCLPKGE